MNKLNRIKRGLFALIMCLSLTLCGCGSNEQKDDSGTSSAETQQSEDVADEEVMSGSGEHETVDNTVITDDTDTFSEPQETTEAPATEKPQTTTATEENTEAETSAPDEPAEEKTENTYEHNEYYDIVETSSFQNSIGYTIVVNKVLAKKDISISSTLLAYGTDGSVIGKSSDDITLTEGQYNFFRYSFEEDISSANIQPNFQAKKESFMKGERNAVEMVQYNQSGSDLYITFEQTGDELGSFAKFKLLFYKGDQIVDTEDGYFSIYAENLNGNGTTDVAEIWAYGIDYDRIEYIFEP